MAEGPRQALLQGLSPFTDEEMKAPLKGYSERRPGKQASDDVLLAFSAWGQIQERVTGRFQNELAFFLTLRLEESRKRNLLSLTFSDSESKQWSSSIWWEEGDVQGGVTFQSPALRCTLFPCLLQALSPRTGSLASWLSLSPGQQRSYRRVCNTRVTKPTLQEDRASKTLLSVIWSRLLTWSHAPM